MHEKLKSEMPNWASVQSLFPPTLPANLMEIAPTHTGTYYKIAFADYHYYILDQLYRPNQTDRETDTDSWARAEMHCIVNNLYSALDSLGQEINLAYQFGISSGEIHIHHRHNPPRNDCVRCRLDQANDSLTSLVNQTLSRSWFDVLRRLYNQIKHRNLPIINVTVRAGGPNTTQILIPNDPSITNPQWNDYSDKLEINKYCLDRRNDIVKFLEESFTLLKPTIKTTFGL
jgi:hypothetical protein